MNRAIEVHVQLQQNTHEDNGKIETSLIKSARDYIFKICGRDFHNVAGWISYVCPLTICTNVVLIFLKQLNRGNSHSR